MYPRRSRATYSATVFIETVALQRSHLLSVAGKLLVVAFCNVVKEFGCGHNYSLLSYSTALHPNVDAQQRRQSASDLGEGIRRNTARAPVGANIRIDDPDLIHQNETGQRSQRR